MALLFYRNDYRTNPMPKRARAQDILVERNFNIYPVYLHK